MGTSENNKKLIKNVLLFALSNFIPKVLSFIMVSVYTSYLTTADYGTSDLIITTASLLLPVFTLDINDAVMRFTIENKEDKRAYRSSVYVLLAGSVVLLFVLGLAGRILKIRWSYMAFIYILYLVSAIYQIKISYLRGMERVSFLVLCGIVNSFTTLLSNIIFITVFKWGMYGFVLSSIAGYLTVVIMAVVEMRKDQIYQAGFSLRKEYSYVKEMLAYSIPLVFSGIAWWINSVSDRYFVSYMVGVAANGVYSVAYKIPTILQTIQAVFSSAWTFSVFGVYKEKEGTAYISKVYDFYSFVIIFVCSILIFLDIPLAKLLFAKEFYSAWKYVPALLISVVFINMSSCVGPILNAYKKSKLSAKGSIYSAVTNIILNVFFINIIGVQGAAVATAVSYMVSWLYSIFQVQKLCDFRIAYKKQVIMLLLLFAEALIVLYCQAYWFSGVIIMLIAGLNIVNLRRIRDILRDLILNRRKKN